MGIGVPGAGKTTALKALAEKYGYIYISPDDIRKELLGDAAGQSKNKEVWREADRRMVEALRNGEGVVVDGAFADHKQRREFIAFAKQNGAERVEGIFMDTPLEIAKERNRGRDRKVPEYAIDRMEQGIRAFPPRIDDGFDAMFVLDESHRLKEVFMAKEGGEMKKEFGKFK